MARKQVVQTARIQDLVDTIEVERDRGEIARLSPLLELVERLFDDELADLGAKIVRDDEIVGEALRSPLGIAGRSNFRFEGEPCVVIGGLGQPDRPDLELGIVQTIFAIRIAGVAFDQIFCDGGQMRSDRQSGVKVGGLLLSEGTKLHLHVSCDH